MSFLDVFKGKKEKDDFFSIATQFEKAYRPKPDKMNAIFFNDYALPRAGPFPLKYYYQLAEYSDTLRVIINALRNEIFRNGYDWKPKFQSVCTNCGKEFDYHVETCPVCGGNCRDPDPEQYKELDEFFKNVNSYGQTLTEVLKQIETDLDIVDNAYLVLLKSYIFDGDGNIIGGKVEEIIRGSPVNFRLVVDEKGNVGGKYYVCPVHRNEVHTKPGKCKCGRKLEDVKYVYEQGGAVKQYYIDGEVLHLTKYTPSETYGFPPILTVWNKVIALMKMDEYVREYYSLQRPPKGLLFIPTDNPESLIKYWRAYLDKTKENPHYIAPLPIPSSQNRQRPEFIDLTTPLTEMQYTEVRNEFRRQIGALYGVMPIFQADLSQSGGLNNEGLQVTVTNRAVEHSQSIFNDKVFPFILKNFGISDWTLELNPSEEKDEMAELQRKQLETSIAQQMRSMGFEVELQNNGDFKYSQKPTQEPQTQEEPFNFPTQRFQGEPENVRRSLEKQDKKKVSELEQNLYQLLEGIDFKNMTPSELKELLKNMSRYVVSNMISTARTQLKQEFLNGIDEAERSSNANAVLSPEDYNIIDKILNQRIFVNAFKKLGIDTVSKIQEIFREAYENPEEYSMDILVNKLYNIVQDKRPHLETIVRTETGNINNLAREIAYKSIDKDGKFKYKWIGPDDNRTTKICRRITERTKNGVTLEELKKIIREEADPKTYTPSRPFSPHINCRHTYVRVV